VDPVDSWASTPSVRQVDVPGRGSPLVWECTGPPAAPTVVLLHGVTMTAELGWSPIISRLADRYRVVAPDLRGHGDGVPRGPGRFSLEECADDVAGLIDALDLGPVIACGYSMGGTVAQLLWRRHPQRVAGLVLCATARNVQGSPFEKIASLALAGITSSVQWHPAAHILTAEVLGRRLLGRLDDPATRTWSQRQLNRTSLLSALSAMHAVSDFTSHEWITQVDVPTAVVVTTEDRLVPESRQRRLAAAIPGADTVELVADHGVCVSDPDQFGAAVLEACRLVVARRYPAEGAPAGTRPTAT
jgi:3-oxoadipate enol-lactonase